MAKTSMIERNNKRRRLAKKFKTRRTRLKAIAADRSLPAEERFAARLKLGEETIVLRSGMESSPSR